MTLISILVAAFETVRYGLEIEELVTREKIETFQTTALSKLTSMLQPDFHEKTPVESCVKKGIE